MSSRVSPAAANTVYQATCLSDVVKFTALASSLAIFIDAAIAHAMFWGNDPYWTYWVTDPLLMATVFGLGTMLFGIGVGRGALITAVHVLLLTIYYWSLSPIGLPSHPEWLDLERTWITGLPVHLTVYYMGYLGAMWLWGRRGIMKSNPHHVASRSLARTGIAALGVTVSIVIVAGLVQTIVLQAFPGLTWFVMRLAVATPFTIAWWLLAGTGRQSAIAGGIVLAFLLITYSHYLGPVGLPSEPARILAENSPPADVRWLSYREEFMVMLPLTAIVASIGYWLASRLMGGERGSPISRRAVVGGMATAAGLVILGVATAENLGPEANRVTVASIGPASLGDDRADATSPLLADLRMTVANRNTHRTPLPPHDRIDLAATITANGQTYEVRANQAMVADPEGRFTTWYGVGFGEWHEGRSGIGLLQTSAMKSDVVAFGLANVSADGEPAVNRVPFQISATRGEQRRLDLRVGDVSASSDVSPLHVSWVDFEADSSMRSKYARYLFGGGVLLVFLVFVFMATRRQQIALRNRREPTPGA